MRVRTYVLPLTASLALFAAGCGGDSGPEKFVLQGAVTVDGKPVESGQVAFEPDGAKGNKGPMTLAPILDGRYRTPDDKGVVGGPHVVRVMANTGRPTEADPHGGVKPLPGSPFTLEMNLPKEADATLDIAVDSKGKK